ncbi:DNA (cytosine-5-)-methyltransferase [Clostridium sp. D2Q-11]|uniref:Cytosine-specific methyltransferase n=1 Tax=Anaeromonas frigoriresistens TaxID=2683708 RepID=A0A942UV37_9FIRM|nr:DNA (cytosine-5-)-methyltransferase [Anaeromonas frigoriresistens]MBS4539643.1 DNA (cytosine-5-)-methyltransferase [Anaeromonas frigoriresistens]
MERTVCELFAGVGGFRLGLEKASKDWDFVWSNQWEPKRKSQDAFQCYIHNFGESDRHVNIDINKVDKSIIPNHNLLVGGFPCQDYSVASTGAKGIQGKKGVLWWSIYETLKVKNPSFILLENVDRLLKSPSKQRGRDFGVMLACLNNLNYSVEWRVINAAEYGFAQRRRRVFIFAYKNDTRFSECLEYNSLREYLHKEGFFQKEFPIQDNSNPKKIPKEIEFDYNGLVDVSDNFSFMFLNSGIMRKGKIYTEETLPDFKGDVKTLGDILEKDVDEKYYLNGELDDWDYMKGSKRIERVSKTGHKYTFSEGAIAFPDPIDKPSRTMLTSESSKNRSTHIIRDPQTNRLRKLTPVECERLNGFDDNWTNKGMSERFRYFCMGNALVVGLVEKMGNALVDIFKKEE